MAEARGLLAELRRRNVPRAAVLYAGAVWALAQGISQLGPAVGFPDWTTRWFLIAAVIGFPFWIAFAWLYEFTPQGLKRESEVPAVESRTNLHSNARKLDFAIMGVLALAVVLLLTNIFVWRKGAGLTSDDVSIAARIPEQSIAVLPLINESGETDQQYFSDGLSEDLITALSQFAGLKVISRNSSFQFRDSKDNAKTIGEKLGVTHLLEGSVQRAGGMVRISAELVNAADGSTQWSQRYDRPYKDLFALQDDITQQVASALKAKLLAVPGAVMQSDRPPSGNLAAWNAYSRGNFHAGLDTPAELREAIDFYSQATQIDPRYARAYAALSQAWSNLGSIFLGGEAQRQAQTAARAAANHALQLEPDMAAAHAARGMLLQWADFDWTGAEAEYRRALQLAPNDISSKSALGVLLGALGHPQQAVGLFQQVIAADPRAASAYFWLTVNLTAMGQLEQAEQALRKGIELAPGSAVGHTLLVMNEVQRGKTKAALIAAQQVSAGWLRDYALALALYANGDHAAADAALKTLIANDAEASAFQIAEVYGLRKEPDKMFDWLDRAWANRDPGISDLLTNPFLLRYKDDPRFTVFCKKVGLPTTTDAVGMK